jgi:hypothetical protein
VVLRVVKESIFHVKISHGVTICPGAVY